MSYSSTPSRFVQIPALVAALLVAAGCPSSPLPPPLIGAGVVGFTPAAAAAGLTGTALVLVLDSSTGTPIETAAVSINGVALTYQPFSASYEGAVSLAAGGAVTIAVSVGARTYATSLSPFSAYPAISSPAAGATWSGLEANALEWTPGAPAQGAFTYVGVVDAADPNGPLLWPPGDLLPIDPATTTSVPPGSLSRGERLVMVGLGAQFAFPGAADGSFVLAYGFDAVAVTVEVGRPIASAPGARQLLAAGGQLVWSDTEAPAKTMPAGGGTPVSLVERQPFPEGALVAGGHVYWISGQELRRSAVDGSATEVLARGTRGSGLSPTCTDLVVDADAAYWVNTVEGGTCSPACRWAVVKVPLDGSPPTTLATAAAEVRALAGDATALYFEQRGSGPVSADGNAPTDSAVVKVPKAGGPAATLVNGLLNGPYPDLGPGYLPGNWLGVGGLALLGGDLYFGDTNFFDRHRILRVPVAGGAVTTFQEVVTGNGSIFVRAMAAEGSTLYWLDTTSVQAAPAAGGPPATLASGFSEGTGLAVGGGLVAWAELSGNSVRQNGAIKAVPAGGGAVTTLASSLDNPFSISLDGSHAYWVEGGPYGLIEGYGRIARAPLAGGATSGVVTTLFTEFPHLATDGTAVFLADGWRVKKAPLAGGPLETALVGNWGIADLATDGVHVYALDGQGYVSRAPVAGGPIEPLAGGLLSGGAVGPIRVGEGQVVWVDSGTLRTMPAVGGAVTALATGLGPVSGLALAGGSAWWSDQASGAIKMLPLGGGTAVLVAAGLPSSASRLAADASSVYWIDATGIGRISIAGGASLRLATGLAAATDLANDVAVDAAGLYWTETGSATLYSSAVK